MDHVQAKEAVRARHRRHIATAYLILVLIWTAGGMSIWTGALKPLSSQAGGKPVAVALAPFGILTWPAHEAALHLEGKGLGANALCQFSMSSVVAFVLWCGLLWAPLLLTRRRSTPLWLGTAAQVLLLLLTFALFFKYGNA